MTDELCPHGKIKMKEIQKDLDKIEEALMFLAGYASVSQNGTRYAKAGLEALDRVRRATQ